MRRVPLLLAAALAACSSDPEPANEAAPRPEPSAAPLMVPGEPLPPGELPAPELAGAEPARGVWVLKEAETGDTALFGPPQSEARFSIRCDREAGRIVFTRSGAAAEAGTTLKIVTATGAATYVTVAAERPMPMLEASTTVNDRFVSETLANAEGRIGVKLGDGPTLAIPADPAIGQVIEECG